jgi:hypothetical protein
MMSRLVSDIPISLHLSVLIAKFKRKEIPAKPFANFSKSWHKIKTAYFHSRVDKVVRFLEADEW